MSSSQPCHQPLLQKVDNFKIKRIFFHQKELAQYNSTFKLKNGLAAVSSTTGPGVQTFIQNIFHNKTKRFL